MYMIVSNRQPLIKTSAQVVPLHGSNYKPAQNSFCTLKAAPKFCYFNVYITDIYYKSLNQF